MNTNQIYRNALKQPTIEDLKQEETIGKEEIDWKIWRSHPQTMEFIKRLKVRQKVADDAAKMFAVNGDEKLLRATNIESLIIDKVLNLTIEGKYASTSQS